MESSTPPTLKNIQIVLKQYTNSLLLNNRSLATNYSQELKNYLETLLPYKEELLALNNSTQLSTLTNKTYYQTLLDLNSLLIDSNISIEPIVSFVPSKSIRDIKFKYLNHTNNLLTFYSGDISDYYVNELRIGQRFKVLDIDNNYLCTGILRTITSNSTLLIEVSSHLLVQYSDRFYATQVDLWWTPNETISIWVDHTCFEDSDLNCWLHTKLSEKKGLYTTVWSLFYKPDLDTPDIEVAKGIDNIQPGYAYLTMDKKLFKAGYYTLKSREIRANNYSSNRLEFNWYLKEASNFIK